MQPAWPEVLALPGAHLHLYGKAEARAPARWGMSPAPVQHSSTGAGNRTARETDFAYRRLSCWSLLVGPQNPAR